VSVSRACMLLGLNRSTYQPKSKSKTDDTELKLAITEIAERKVHAGRPYMVWYIRERLNMMINHKRIERVYTQMGMSMRKRPKKKKRPGQRHLFVAPTQPNELWAMDFVSDSFISGRKFRVLTVKDLFTHECICLYADRSIPGAEVARQLEKVISVRGAKPKAIICDNGPEFISKAMDQFENRNGLQLRFIEPGKPIQNAFIESFNGKFRKECLDMNWFTDLNDVRKTFAEWRTEYNTERPTKPLGKLTPSEFAFKHGAVISNFVN
jgi:putative transposase